jgi:hypothetical protein
MIRMGDEYFTVSISGFMFDKVREYIENQEVYHKKINSKDEFDKFISKYELEKQG